MTLHGHTFPSSDGMWVPVEYIHWSLTHKNGKIASIMQPKNDAVFFTEGVLKKWCCFKMMLFFLQRV